MNSWYQSSDSDGLVQENSPGICTQAGADRVALRWPLGKEVLEARGAMNLSSPTGGCAKGIPRKTKVETSLQVVPDIVPALMWTRGLPATRPALMVAVLIRRRLGMVCGGSGGIDHMKLSMSAGAETPMYISSRLGHAQIGAWCLRRQCDPQRCQMARLTWRRH